MICDRNEIAFFTSLCFPLPCMRVRVQFSVFHKLYFPFLSFFVLLLNPLLIFLVRNPSALPSIIAKQGHFKFLTFSDQNSNSFRPSLHFLMMGIWFLITIGLLITVAILKKKILPLNLFLPFFSPYFFLPFVILTFSPFPLVSFRQVVLFSSSSFLPFSIYHITIHFASKETAWPSQLPSQSASPNSTSCATYIVYIQTICMLYKYIYIYISVARQLQKKKEEPSLRFPFFLPLLKDVLAGPSFPFASFFSLLLSLVLFSVLPCFLFFLSLSLLRPHLLPFHFLLPLAAAAATADWASPSFLLQSQQLQQLLLKHTFENPSFCMCVTTTSANTTFLSSSPLSLPSDLTSPWALVICVVTQCIHASLLVGCQTPPPPFFRRCRLPETVFFFFCANVLFL